MKLYYNSDMKTAIFGGSFDPIHKGHLEIIDRLSKMFDKVIVLPNYQNPLKSNATPAKKRLEWLTKSITQNNVEISEFEINQNKPCYTIDTIKHFKQFYDKITFVIGADNLLTLDKWKKIDELKKSSLDASRICKLGALLLSCFIEIFLIEDTKEDE